MKLLKLSGCQFPGSGGNVNRLTMIVEEQGIGFWTRVQLPSAPLLINSGNPGFTRVSAAFLCLISCIHLYALLSHEHLYSGLLLLDEQHEEIYP